MDQKTLGILGENMAKNFLLDKAYSILTMNFRFKKGEIDIIAQKENTTVFVEVKTRQNNYLGEPWRAVTKKKQKQIVQVAHEYLVLHNIDQESRFDIISIVHDPAIQHLQIEHIEDAFYAML
jgi:putative endonuclease